MNLHQIIEQHWQYPHPILRLFLSPLSKLFAQIAQHRRAQFLSDKGSLKTQKLPIPVVVVGNIHAGGTGKTPITAALVADLQARGIKVGIISRGYGRKSKQIHVLHANSTADEVGDEPLMLYRRTHAPTAVAANRHAAGMALIAQYPDLQMIIADDGLQHYQLARDVEICVFPTADVGRTDLDVLPNGGLREPVSRLQDVDFIVVSNADKDIFSTAQTYFRLPICAYPSEKTLFFSQTQAAAPYRLNQPNDILSAGSLKNGARCVAVAAIARPQRFFNTLIQMGFILQETRVLPDHAAIDVSTLPRADYVLITEKDAVKLPANAPDNIWVVPIQAQISPDLTAEIMQKLGFQAALS
ncbi:tetraacyldisaccharide 4'-kinase [Wielerella bovis]|uniref:tetraacyldisaccharide 4'-kinase n=1 Tax=Wielerella bovis TaxID=2917790 RepID=UPI002018A237|nr:tetraacyldisaccharide 4'-kinase [Wielerella bovis]MCG7657895.1 tetraacyldisaccharide 4'-kinase [Wielerella bovis]MCG7660117.1 tetraacyldisaccharide 4'-kinase [Wielerella bovis]